MSWTLNQKCGAASAIAEGKISDAPFDESSVPRDSAHAAHFLAVDTSEKPDVEAHWKEPVLTASGEASLHALANAESRARSSGEAEIANHAKELFDKAKKKHDAAKSLGFPAIIKLPKRNQYGDCIGPLGFPMLSKIASEVDSMIRKQPREVRDHFKTVVRDAKGNLVTVEGYTRKAEAAKITFPEGERSEVSVVTTDSKDRDGDVVMPSGFDWEHFRKNPVVPFAHDYQSLPVGKSQWITWAKTANGEGWKAKTVYVPRPADHPQNLEWGPDTVFHYIKEGFLPGKSVGFIPMSMREPTDEEVRRRPDWEGANLVDKCLGLEYSPVPVPANQDALVEAVAKAFAGGKPFSKSFMDACGIVLPSKDMSDDDSDGEDEMEEPMPTCPKCMTNEHVESVDDYEPSENQPPALYRCMNCGLHFHGDTGKSGADVSGFHQPGSSARGHRTQSDADGTDRRKHTFRDGT